MPATSENSDTTVCGSGRGSASQVISHVDPVLHVLLERIVGLVDRDDAVARLLRDALFDATRLHILDAYGTCRRAVAPEGGRELDDVTRDRLSEFLHDSLNREVNLAALAEIGVLTGFVDEEPGRRRHRRSRPSRHLNRSRTMIRAVTRAPISRALRDS
ncbi:hypothetical protein MUG78_05715 [Gordonia alkaliphila]|uniref:hypothetical protein n=1 Tax=Gordonia alkaliphila TaxID=1053547 RepID=UPI001FF5BD5B|nr:hypothetical protein [Gordonia alkaliphila]MCK0438975.1 hypothetical protein [Gordonia alkaliphila]